MMRLKHVAIFCLLLLPELALAHKPIKGLSHFVNGLVHPFLVPAQVLLVLAFGFLIGQKGLTKLGRPYVSFTFALITGLVITGLINSVDAEIFVLSLAALIGLLNAASLKIPQWSYFLIAIIVGFSLGLDSSQEAFVGKAKFAALFGSGVTLYFFSLYPIGLAEYCQKGSWQKITIRILSSWITASALLALALQLHSNK